MRKCLTGHAVWSVCLSLGVMAQGVAKIDFARDVQPILKQNCVGCHGPTLQINGLRLDRKSSVFQTGMRRVVPGSSQNSFLYHRLVGSEFGAQMPPTKALREEHIQTIKSWIDQGAVWPDSLAGEDDPPAVDSKAATVVEMLRSGDRAGFLKRIAADPKLLNVRGPGGSTPFMYSVLYGDVPLLQQLLKKGANVNARDDAKASALLWAATDLAKTQLLLDNGADANAMSARHRTPLMVAAGRPGGAAVVKLLLDRGANPNPTTNPMSEGSPLTQAAMAADGAVMQLLLERGADAKQAGVLAFVASMIQGCSKCVELLLGQGLPPVAYTAALQSVAGFASPAEIRMLLDRGADVNEPDPGGRTALMNAVVSDLIPEETVKLLIEKGADVNAISKHQKSQDSEMSVLDIARMQGETPVVELLVKAGAKSARQLAPAPAPKRGKGTSDAIARALPMIQASDAGFTAKSGCISCHNNSLAAMTVGLARSRGFKLDERTAAQQVKVNLANLASYRDGMYQGTFPAQAGSEAIGDAFGPAVLAYILVGLKAEHHKADLDTDAVAMYLKSRQTAAGNWIYQEADTRQPIGSDYMGQTALVMRALQLYAPKGMEAEYEKSVRLAAGWLARTATRTNEDRFWQLQALAWAGYDKAATERAMKDVLSRQRADGGWSDLPTTPSTAYATGRALVALHAAGLAVDSAAYTRGVEYLLNTQQADGTWFVRTRSLGFQPYFETGFPHGINQSMSAAGTSWATMALTLAAGGAGGVTSGTGR